MCDGTSSGRGLDRNGRYEPAEDVSSGAAAVNEDTLRRLAALIAASPHNLVARAQRTAVYERHLLEAAMVGRMLQPGPGERWLDLGTGGGVPGLVLAMQHPDTEWVLVDATRKKVDEVRRFADEFELGNVASVHGRAEVLAHGTWRATCAGVVARAVAPLATLCELARGFLAPGGELAAIKGPAWESELQAAAEALRTLRLTFVHSDAVAPQPRSTWLVTMRAAGPPPAGYPRRDGIPRAQPLGRPPA